MMTPGRLERLLTAVGTLSLLALMGIVFVDVLGRNLFNRPLLWGTELAEVLASRGVVVEPENVDQFTQAITALADQPQRGRELGLAAQSWARLSLDKDVILAAVEAAMSRYSTFKGQGASA